MKSSEKNILLNDCRGCAAKIPQFVLNNSLINSNLNSWQKVLPLYPISPIN